MPGRVACWDSSPERTESIPTAWSSSSLLESSNWRPIAHCTIQYGPCSFDTFIFSSESRFPIRLYCLLKWTFENLKFAFYINIAWCIRDWPAKAGRHFLGSILLFEYSSNTFEVILPTLYGHSKIPLWTFYGYSTDILRNTFSTITAICIERVMSKVVKMSHWWTLKMWRWHPKVKRLKVLDLYAPSDGAQRCPAVPCGRGSDCESVKENQPDRSAGCPFSGSSKSLIPSG